MLDFDEVPQGLVRCTELHNSNAVQAGTHLQTLEMVRREMLEQLKREDGSGSELRICASRTLADRRVVAHILDAIDIYHCDQLRGHGDAPRLVNDSTTDGPSKAINHP
jgi:hypothetical protein